MWEEKCKVLQGEASLGVRAALENLSYIRRWKLIQRALPSPTGLLFADLPSHK